MKASLSSRDPSKCAQEEFALALKRILVVTLFILSIAVGTVNVSAAPLLSSTSRQAVFLSPWERWMPTWYRDGYVTQLERAGYHVDILLNEDVSISFLMTGLANYDLIILRTESFYDEGLSYYCSGEPVTSKSSTTFAAQIAARELQVSHCIGFSMLFLKHNYSPGSLRQGLVYVFGGPSAELSTAFISAGAAVFIGFYEPYSLGWGRMDALSIKYFRYLAQGSTIKDATLQLYNYLNTGHGSTSTWPIVYWYGNGGYKI
ncbi:hypothetical protein MUP07_01100 [Candidatus Bathyarchaeota archaeon]|nr:hypothetical protein [Candidatus Bathyarchaeota archaeon]